MFDIKICQTVENQIQDSLDARKCPSNDPQIVEHVRICPDCERRLQEFLQLSALLETAYPTQYSSSSVPNSNKSIPEFAPQMLNPCVSTGATKENLPAVSNLANTASERQNRVLRPSLMNWQSLLGTLAASILVIAMLEGRDSIHVNMRGPELSSIRSQTVTSPSSSPVPVVSSWSIPSPSDFWRKSNYSKTSSASLVTCYELTSELPGIRPLQASVEATIEYFQHTIVDDKPAPPAEPASPKKENGKTPKVGNFASPLAICLA